MIFSQERGGTIHHYEVIPEGLKYSAGTKTQTLVRWDAILSLTPRDVVYLELKGNQRFGIWLDREKSKALFTEFFSAWKKADFDRATRIAFVYGSTLKTSG